VSMHRLFNNPKITNPSAEGIGTVEVIPSIGSGESPDTVQLKLPLVFLNRGLNAG